MRRQGAIRAALAAGLALAPAASRATDVEVHVYPVDHRGGVVRAQVCPQSEFLKDCSYKGIAPAHPGDVVVLVRGVPPGVYSVVAFHDANDNGDVDQDALGIPTEGVGFSRDPMMLLGPPAFADSALRISGERVRVDVGLKFEP